MEKSYSITRKDVLKILSDWCEGNSDQWEDTATDEEKALSCTEDFWRRLEKIKDGEA